MAVGSSSMGDASDLIGDLGDQSSSQNGNQDTGSGAMNAVQSGINQANQGKDAAEQAKETERKMCREKWQEYIAAREFDKAARMGYAQDRKYAAGMSDPSWASDANLIGSFIDILTAFLYAQNPDVSGRAAAQVGSQPQADSTAFAETAEVIVSRLWKVANLKRRVRKQVRSTLTVGQGWIKALMWSKKRPQPQVEKELHDAEEQAARIDALVQSQQYDADKEDPAVTQEKIALQIQGLRAKIMKNTESGMSIDHVRSEDIQVSLDVSDIGDYLDADWMSEDMYIPKASLKVRFPRLDEDSCTKAAIYYQKNLPANSKGDAYQAATGEEASDGAFSKSAGVQQGAGKPIEFVKVVEFWDRRDSNIFTMVDGVDMWAVEPYTPPQASTRFYPYFGLQFFPVDGHRHPQSLCFRLRKLQDEYASARSNQRLTRERSIPGLIFNRGAMSPEDAHKLENSVIAEMVGIMPTEPNLPLQNIIMPKALPTVDIRLWDTTAIRQDMEAVSGVQEAQQQSISQQPKTATEAQIQQSGFASRTGADRDVEEDMLTDLAHYTLETSIQELQPENAQRIAGPKAFWPFGMDIQDLLTLVEIDIDAGTTGKPDLAADKANWATILPLLQKLMVQIRQLQGADPALAGALTNLLRESLKRMDDRLEIDQFVPTTPPPPTPPPAPPPPSVSISLKGEVPPLDSSVIAAKAAGLPPEAALADGGATSTAMQHASGMHEGELPPHPLMPEPLPEPKAAPHTQGKMQ